MKIEFEMDDQELRNKVLVTIKDYVLDNRMLQSMVRNAIYELTADAAQEVLKTHKEDLAELVVDQLRQVVRESLDGEYR